MFNKEFVLIDTAGIRKKTKVHEDIEFYSVIRAIKAIDESDICVLMIDAKKGVEMQDLKIFSMIVEKKRGVVILVNKWDLVEKDTKTAKAMEDRIREKLAPFNDVPIIFTSATEKVRIFKAIESSLSVFENKQQQFKTSVLNEWLKESVDNYAPPTVKGKFVNIKYITQLPSRSLSFAVFCSNHTYIREPYRNYLEKRLRDRFNLTGIPINIFFREK
jgi:GTP-binding protein